MRGGIDLSGFHFSVCNSRRQMAALVVGYFLHIFSLFVNGLNRIERRNLEPDYSADPMLFHAAIACARGSSDT